MPTYQVRLHVRGTIYTTLTAKDEDDAMCLAEEHVNQRIDEFADDFFAEAEGLKLMDATTCKLPPEGWQCSRGDGHEGPCAARRF